MLLLCNSQCMPSDNTRHTCIPCRRKSAQTRTKPLKMKKTPYLALRICSSRFFFNPSNKKHFPVKFL